jgi:NO-binding membrane sensor protein with MHYT domain
LQRLLAFGILCAMELVEFGHNYWLVAVSLVVALVAGATGLYLTKNVSQKPVAQRKLAVALASVALGGGIWSMHFVAMLGLQMPILFYYDAAITLVSALIAILMVGIALILLHFANRSRGVIITAGAIVGAGILTMHYVGMAGMQLCKPVYTTFGVVSSSAIAVGLCIVAFLTAYGGRSDRNIVLGTVCFGVAVFAVHFLAMAGTSFVALPETQEFGPLISNDVLALGVILSSFVLFGAFLWVGSTQLITEPVPEFVALHSESRTSPEPASKSPLHIPCEKDGHKMMVPVDDILCLQADGHYTHVFTSSGRHFCGWPITKATSELVPEGFVKVHRSYLVNPAKVARFERGKDKGQCTFATGSVPPVPVSRSHLKDVAAAFG